MHQEKYFLMFEEGCFKMASLNLSKYEKKTWRAHYLIRVNKIDIAYSYIRKNACTTFKRFFVELSNNEKLENENALQFMERVHRADLSQVAAANIRLCVLRDPVERMVSLFQNKFCVRSGHEDIFKSYQKITGRPAESASFSDFVNNYLSQDTDDLDPHCYSQYSHLMPVEYESVCQLKDLHAEMSNRLGATLGDRFFSQKLNKTEVSGETYGDFSEIGSEDIRRMGIVPPRKNLCNDVLANSIRRVYSADCEIMSISF